MSNKVGIASVVSIVLYILVCMHNPLMSMRFTLDPYNEKVVTDIIRSEDPRALEKWIKKSHGNPNFALHFAIRYAKPTMVKVALDNGAKANAVAVIKQTDENIKFFANDSPLLTLLGGASFLPREYKPSEKVINDMVELLLMAKADVNVVSKGLIKRTPLMYAAYFGYRQVANTLLNFGAEINAQEPDSKNTALMYAIERKHVPVIELLLEHDACPARINRHAQSALTLALRTSQNIHQLTNVVMQLLTQLDKISPKVKNKIINGYDSDGLTPFMWAVKYNYSPVVDLLIAHGADVNQTVNKHGLDKVADSTAQQLKLRGGQTAPPVAEPQGATPLMIAVKNGHINLLMPLLAAGADVESKDKAGKTVFEYAQEAGNIDALNTAITEYQATVKKEIQDSNVMPRDLLNIVSDYAGPDMGTQEKKKVAHSAPGGPEFPQPPAVAEDDAEYVSRQEGQ